MFRRKEPEPDTLDGIPSQVMESGVVRPVFRRFCRTEERHCPGCGAIVPARYIEVLEGVKTDASGFQDLDASAFRECWVFQHHTLPGGHNGFPDFCALSGKPVPGVQSTLNL